MKEQGVCPATRDGTQGPTHDRHTVYHWAMPPAPTLNFKVSTFSVPKKLHFPSYARKKERENRGRDGLKEKWKEEGQNVSSNIFQQDSEFSHHLFKGREYEERYQLQVSDWENQGARTLLIAGNPCAHNAGLQALDQWVGHWCSQFPGHSSTAILSPTLSTAVQELRVSGVMVLERPSCFYWAGCLRPHAINTACNHI